MNPETPAAIPPAMQPIVPEPEPQPALPSRWIRWGTAIRRLLHSEKVVGMGGGVLGFVLVAVPMYHYGQPVRVQALSGKQAVNAPINVTFAQPVRASLKYNLSPAIKGEWHTSKDILGGITQLSFTPSQQLPTSTTYLLNLHHLQPLVSMNARDEVIRFITEDTPSMTLVSPAKQTDVPVNTVISVRLQSPNHGIRKLELVSGQAALQHAGPTTSDDQTFTWHFAHALNQGTTYQLQLKDLNQSGVNQVVQNIAFTTVAEPKIVQATATDHLYPGQPITVQFDQDIVQATAKVTFTCTGKGSWQNARMYSFLPDALAPAATCQYVVAKGLRTTAGGVLEADHTYQVSAPGNAYVVASAPHGSSVALASTVTVTFDQPVDHASAQAAFSLSPAVAGSFTWADNSMAFHPTGFAYQTTYSLAVAEGVKATYGLPGKAYRTSFTTLPEVIKLAVPAYKQQYRLSCEASSLRMALAFHGVSVSDMDVLNHMGYSPHPRDTATNSWDNPNQMFVGDVNGSEDVSGWGVNGGPVAAAALSLGRSATYVSGISAQQISQAIHGSNPVVLWGVMPNAAPRLDSWNTSSGPVKVVANSHVRTVYGVVGSESNPIGFYLHDPIYGDLYWTTAQLISNMSAGGLMPSQGVIVD